MQKTYTILSLGDSYTIGEGVALYQNFPYQAVQCLRKEWGFAAPEIIAKTGWTTVELAAALAGCSLLTKYDFVTLLIGVNDQYRDRTVEEYKVGFESLLKGAIHLAGEKGEHVIVLSIPDYSCTPYVPPSNKEKVASGVGLYNSVNKALSIQYKVNYIDITTGTLKAAENASLLADDGLHYSPQEYYRWGVKIVDIIKSCLKN